MGRSGRARAAARAAWVTTMGARVGEGEVCLCSRCALSAASRCEAGTSAVAGSKCLIMPTASSTDKPPPAARKASDTTASLAATVAAAVARLVVTYRF